MKTKLNQKAVILRFNVQWCHTNLRNSKRTLEMDGNALSTQGNNPMPLINHYHWNCHMFFICSFRVHAEQMVFGSDIFSLEIPKSEYLKGKMRKKGLKGWLKNGHASGLWTFCPVCWLMNRNKNRAVGRSDFFQLGTLLE